MPRPVYENYYKCPRCKTEWRDLWCAMCNDRCPKCHWEITPIKSIEAGYLCNHPDC
jgi:hypothetical protein